MNVEELNAHFSKWNPMQSDFVNTKFNQYISGPGADLDEELQPAQQALQKKSEKGAVPTIVFKDVPKEMTIRALHNICSKHGKVREVRDSKKNAFYFVDMATVADMEAVFRALTNNDYGITLLVGKEKKEKPSHMEMDQGNQNFQITPPRRTGIDFESRTYRTSKKNHPRPKVAEENLFNDKNVTNTHLPLNLLANDAHSLERQGLNKTQNYNKFSYRNGRAYVNMPEKTKQFIDKKHKDSSGTLLENENKYVHTSEGGAIPTRIRKCSQCYYSCDTVCQRCSQYYCSVECQKNDWPVHRYKCGKPEHLQKTPPSQKDNKAEFNSAKMQKEKNNVATDFEQCKEVTIKGVSAEQLLKSKNIPKQLQSVAHTTSQPNPTTSKSSLQLPNSQNIYPQSTQNPTLSSKSSAKRLPAALRIQSTQHSNSPKEPSHSQNISPQSTQNPTLSSKSSAKKIPAALRIQSTQQSNSPKEPTQQQITSQKSSPQQPSNSASQNSFPQQPSNSASPQNPSKNSSENSVAEYKQNMPRSGNIVNITAISKTNVVFIRSTTYEENLSYISTVDRLQKIGKILSPLKTLPKSGEVVIAKFEEQYNRALVLSVVSPTKIAIHFMDYGNMELAKFEELLEAPKELKYKPRHAIPVLLKDVTDVYMTQEIGKFMHSYLNNINVEVRYKPEDFREDNKVYAVELIDETTQQNLNKMIMKLSKPVEPMSSDEICDRDYLERKLLPGGDNIELIVMDNSLMSSGCVSCTTKPYAIEIEKFKKDIQAYVASIPEEAYTPRVNELCIAQYNEDGLWYRGVCLETVGDGHPSIHFIDYGNITIVPIESIRRYPRQFTYPIYTADCAIEGIPEFCDDKLVEVLEDLIPNGELIKCENVTVDEESNFYILSMPNVIRELTKLGLINI